MSHSIDYQLTRSKRRKSVAIQVSSTGVEVKAPYRVSSREINAFVLSKEHWIKQKLSTVQQRQQQIPSLRGINGEKLNYLGRPKVIQLSTGARHKVLMQGDCIQVIVSRRTQPDQREKTSKRLIEDWLKQQALNLLTEKSIQLAARINRKPSLVKVRRTKSKWGHCTLTGELQYNWLIILAPDEIVDYLVSHEVAHLVHHNHSANFWLLVEQLCPNWRQHRLWLKQNGHRLNV